MSQKRKNEKEETTYFITLELRDKAALFLDPPFRTQVEQHWAAVMQQHPDLRDAEYVVNDTAVHALIALPPDQPGIRELLGRAIDTFMALARADWTGEGELWAADYKIRAIENAEELRSLRDFIVQKMLGGKELSDLEADEEDAEDDNGYYGGYK